MRANGVAQNRKSKTDKWPCRKVIAFWACGLAQLPCSTCWLRNTGLEQLNRERRSNQNQQFFIFLQCLHIISISGEYPNKYCDHIDLISTSTYEFWYFELKWNTHMAIYLRGKSGARTASYALIASAAREPTQCSKCGVVPYHTSRLQITVSIDFSLSSCSAIHTFLGWHVSYQVWETKSGC